MYEERVQGSNYERTEADNFALAKTQTSHLSASATIPTPSEALDGREALRQALLNLDVSCANEPSVSPLAPFRLLPVPVVDVAWCNVVERRIIVTYQDGTIALCEGAANSDAAAAATKQLGKIQVMPSFLNPRNVFL